MADIDADKEEKAHPPDTFSLQRERRRIWIMKWMFALLSVIMILSLLISLLTNS
jgi:hypothetical protein